MSHRRHWILAVLLLAFLSAPSCIYTPPGPAQGTSDLGVPFFAQARSYYCVPAAILMWRNYKFGYGTTVETLQEVIWNWTKDHYPGQAIDDVGVINFSAVTGTANNFVGGVEFQQYNSNQDQVALKQAIADEQKGVEQGSPTIVVTSQATHVVVVKGVTWHRLNDAIQRPNQEFIHVHDPARPFGNTSWTLGDWLQNQIPVQTGNCFYFSCAYQFQKAGIAFTGTPALEQFEQEGGTYVGPGPSQPTGRWKLDGWGGCYWEANDSGPDQCTGSAPTGRYKDDGHGGCYWDPNDSGPDQCVPPHPVALVSVLRHAFGRLFPRSADRASSSTRASLGTMRATQFSHTTTMNRNQVGATPPSDRTSKSATRNGTHIPHPYGTRDSEIMENVAAAIQQSHLAEAVNIPELAMRHNELRARRILDVKSMTKRADFYVVELEDYAGTSVANVAIEKSGILLGVEQTHGVEAARSLDLAVASTRARRYIAGPPTRVHYVHLIGPAETGSPLFAPLAAVESPDGTIYYNSRGEAFADESSTVAKRSGVVDNEPIHPAMAKLRKLRDQP
jgi:hypothetical protein